MPICGLAVQIYVFFNLGAIWGVGGQGHATRVFSPVPIVQEVQCAQGRSGRLQKTSSLPGFDPGPFGP